jgi:hypothetical protein
MECNSVGYMYAWSLAGARLARPTSACLCEAGRLVFRACTDGAGTGDVSSFWGRGPARHGDVAKRCGWKLSIRLWNDGVMG